MKEKNPKPLVVWIEPEFVEGPRHTIKEMYLDEIDNRIINYLNFFEYGQKDQSVLRSTNRRC